MSRYEIDLVFEEHDTLGEGPVWDDATHRLYWTDIPRGAYHAFEPASGKHKLVRVGTPVGTIALRETNGLLLATKEGFAFHDPDRPGKPELLGNPESHLPDTRFNDGAVDPQGRFWAGTYGGENNSLYRLDPDGSIHTMASGFGVPNGMGWSLDGKTMYFTDSDQKTIYTYDFDPASGGIENQRVFIDTQDDDGVPDGLAVDSEGFLWSVRFDGWRVERYDPEGKLERVIMLPVQRPTSCAFGGKDFSELFVSSAKVGLTDKELEGQPNAGGLFRIHSGVQSRPEHRFKG